jgi:uncharacterized protein YqcC (DUF446 family)
VAKRSLAPEPYDFQRAFALDTMAFSQWLQFIFIPRVRALIQTRSEFPSNSSVGAQAVREFDGFEEAAELILILSEFDALFRSRKLITATIRQKVNTDSHECCLFSV